MKYWLIKSEEGCYSIDDFKKDKKVSWEEIRNYQARNYMVRDMSVGDLAFFYHSMGNPTGVAGIAKVSSKPHPDLSQFDKKSEYFDPKSKIENPTWQCVDFSFVEKFPRIVSLEEIKKDKNLSGIVVAAKGSRLSIQPVSEKHFKRIVELSKQK